MMRERKVKDRFAFSRRNFLKTFSSTAAAAATAQIDAVAAELENVNREKLHGPGPVPILLKVNGKDLKLEVEPRVTLLEALRANGLSGGKEVCDRATCGACTVLLEDTPVYACSMLAIEAQGRSITTIEGLGQEGKLTKVQQAFIEQDALMCGYCTPGFVMSVTGLLRKNPQPTADEVRHACSGNLCRCGTYPRVLQAALKATGANVSHKSEVIPYAKLA